MVDTGEQSDRDGERSDFKDQGQDVDPIWASMFHLTLFTVAYCERGCGHWCRCAAHACARARESQLAKALQALQQTENLK
jgi:hypothetical protein